MKKVWVVKHYVSKSDVFFNYGDDCAEFWHNFKAIEDAKEVSDEEFVQLQRAVELFNKLNAGKKFFLEVVEVLPEDLHEVLVSDLLAYEQKEAKALEARQQEEQRRAREAQALKEAKKKARAVTKLAKELNLPIEEVQKLLDKN